MKLKVTEVHDAYIVVEDQDGQRDKWRRLPSMKLYSVPGGIEVGDYVDLLVRLVPRADG